MGWHRFFWTLIWDNVPVSKQVENYSKDQERNSNRTSGRRVAVECCPDRSIDVHISRLRKKLSPHSDGSERIKAVHGVGHFYSLPAEFSQGEP
ncbi:winged helix-turn-helix domain-containing protein [Malonomonas rubra]|uniref:winged helix-turn-helix domain-containing protein n=1 Tax=Malonomonas rubra TaxID=57040 RepID=UPI0026EA9612|nr:winged helix-turn-helix domain-containing protein [Malonomonas rubra]